MQNNFPINPFELKKQFDEMQAFVDDVKREENAALKKMFGSKIKQNFLIEMKERILKTSEYNLLAPKVYDIYNLSSYRLLIGTDNPSFDICKHVTMIHRSNTLLLSDGERASLQNDEKYKKKLEEQVLLQIKLRNYGEEDFTRKSLESFSPIIYFTNVVSNYLTYKFNDIIRTKSKKNQHNYIFKVQMIHKMIGKFRACCRMIDGRLIEEAYNPLRSLVELIMIFFCISHSEKYSNEYMKFVGYQLQYQNEIKISDVLQNKYDRRFKNSSTKVTIIDYMNFGWLDVIIPEFGYINDNEKKYKIRDTALLLDMVYKRTFPNMGTILYRYYRECNPMSHGVNNGINYFVSQVTICQKLLFLASLMSKVFKDYFDIDFILEEINLLSKADELIKDTDTVLKAIEKDEKLNQKVNDGNYVSIV